MREIKITYNHIKNIRARADTIIKDLNKRDLLDDEIEGEILTATSLDAIDHLVSVIARIRNGKMKFDIGILSYFLQVRTV